MRTLFALALALAAVSPPLVTVAPDRQGVLEVRAPGLPAVTPDGSRVAIAYSGEDGARGDFNLALVIRDVKTDRVLQREVVAKAGALALSPEALQHRLAALNRALARTAWVPLKRYPSDRKPGTGAPEVSTVVAGELTMSFREPRLTVRRGERVLLDQRYAGWSAPVTRFAERCEDGPCECRNPAYLAEAAVDEARRVVMVKIGYAGTDACWEPDSQVHVLRLPGSR
jgi:hypothetical protein